VELSWKNFEKHFLLYIPKANYVYTGVGLFSTQETFGEQEVLNKYFDERPSVSWTWATSPVCFAHFRTFYDFIYWELFPVAIH